MTDKENDIAVQMAMNTYMQARATDALTHLFMGAAIAFMISLGLVALSGFLPLADPFGVSRVDVSPYNNLSEHIPTLIGARMVPIIHWDVPPTLLIILFMGFVISGLLSLRFYFKTHEILTNVAAMVAIDDQEGGSVFGGGVESKDDEEEPPSDDQKV